jgi:hypothetical protein
MSDEERLDHGGECYEWEREPDLTSISEEELNARLTELNEEERALSYRRRVLQGRIDLIRAELIRRGGVTLSPADLARVLMGGEDNRSVPPDLEGGGS